MNELASLGSMTMIFVFVIPILLIGAGLSFGLAAFYGNDLDFREADASALNFKVTKCLSENEFSYSSESFSEDFFEVCKLNKEVISSESFISISFNGEMIYTEGKGDRTLCSLGAKNKNYPVCESRTLVKNENKILIETGANQQAEKIRT